MEIKQSRSTGIQKHWSKQTEKFPFGKEGLPVSNLVEMHLILIDTATVQVHNIHFVITAPLQKDPGFNCDWQKPKTVRCKKYLP